MNKQIVKGCPCCAGPAELQEFTEADDPEVLYQVFCMDVDCGINGVIRPDPIEVVSRWNKRPSLEDAAKSEFKLLGFSGSMH